MHEPRHRSLPMLRGIAESLAFRNPSVRFSISCIYRFRGILLRFANLQNIELPSSVRVFRKFYLFVIKCNQFYLY